MPRNKNFFAELLEDGTFDPEGAKRISKLLKDAGFDAPELGDRQRVAYPKIEAALIELLKTYKKPVS